MQFDPPLIAATLIRRYKRFLAEITIKEGKNKHYVTAHCPNPGAMPELAEPQSSIWVARQKKPKKLLWQWQLTQTAESLVGINTLHANSIVAEALAQKSITPLQEYDHIRREVRIAQQMRIDFVLTSANKPACYLEVKSVTLRQDDKQPYAVFPDTTTIRGQKHMRILAQMAAQGIKTAVLFLVQRSDCHAFRPARTIDPIYAECLCYASQMGTQLYAYDCFLSPDTINIRYRLPIMLT